MRGITNGRGVAPLIDADFRQRPVHSTERAVGMFEFDSVRAPSDLPGRGHRLKTALDGVNGLGWSVLGFIVGAAFWHVVGFWAFVSNVVLAGGSGEAKYERPAMHVEERVQTADASDVSGACVSLALDRRTGATSAVACDFEDSTFAADQFQGREDRIGSESAVDWVAPYAPAGALGAVAP